MLSTPTTASLDTRARVQRGHPRFWIVAETAKYVTASNPFCLFPCLPVASDIAVCSMLAVPLEPSWLPATLLHVPCLFKRKKKHSSVRADKDQTGSSSV